MYLLALVLISIFLTSCSGSAVSTQQIALGKQVYEQHCASCHGLNGQGQYPDAPYKSDKSGRFGAPPHDSTGHTWHHPDPSLMEIIKYGRNAQGFQPMPAFSDKLTDDEIRAVLLYMKTWWKPEQISSQATVNALYTPPASK